MTRSNGASPAWAESEQPWAASIDPASQAWSKWPWVRKRASIFHPWRYASSASPSGTSKQR